MKLYRTAKGEWVRTQGQAGKGHEAVDIRPDKEGILGLLNRFAGTVEVNESPAYKQGRMDAERGITTNPFSSPDLRSEWEAGHAHTFELGLAELPSFAAQTRGVSRFDGKRRKVKELN